MRRKVKAIFNVSVLAGLQRKRTNRVVLLASGGVESTAAGILLAQEGFMVYPFFVDYGQRAASAEFFSVRQITKKLSFCKPRVYKEPNILQLGHGFGGGQEVSNDADAWVPGRNTLLMMLAGIYSIKIDADGLAIGYCLDDNFVFGDNDLTHHQLMEVTLTRSFARPFSVQMPLSGMSKKDAVTLLLKHNVLDATVSCWNARRVNGCVKVCGKCANCLERFRAIAEVG